MGEYFASDIASDVGVEECEASAARQDIDSSARVLITDLDTSEMRRRGRRRSASATATYGILDLGL